MAPDFQKMSWDELAVENDKLKTLLDCETQSRHIVEKENEKLKKLLNDIREQLAEKIPKCSICGKKMEVFGANNELYACISKCFEHTQFDRCTVISGNVEEVLEWIEGIDLPIPKIEYKFIGCLECEECGKKVAEKDEENNRMLCFECFGKDKWHG